MQRSSEKIGEIAAALARAQAELSNPEKSLTATINSPSQQEGNRTFRYAPLSSGLDIIRKSLGKHEIATVQTTCIDMEAGLIRLTTLLAHSSGEWVSSDWPVCAVTDTAAPRRMGAALTYARRYALFTLVGIAGEDDLDAPDLNSGNAETRKVEQELPGQHPSTGHSADQRRVGGRSRARSPQPGLPIILPASESASVRDRLLRELSEMQAADDAASWALRNLPIKNTLRATDAQDVETGFAAALMKFTDPTPPVSRSNATAEPGTSLHDPTSITDQITSAPSENHKVLTATRLTRKVIRLRDKEHRRFVSHQPCVVCGRRPSDAHHLRFAQPRALSRKVSDEFVVPVCRLHHREIHRHGDEASWWTKLGIDPMAVASQLWRNTHTGNNEIGSVSLSVSGRSKKQQTKLATQEAQ